MSDVPVQIVVAAFKDEATADQALRSLKELQSEKQIKIRDAAVLRKDETGKLHIKETADMGGGKGAVTSSTPSPEGCGMTIRRA